MHIKKYNQLFFAVLFILFSLATALSAEEVIDSIAAVIDEEIILESEISYGVSTLLLESGVRYPTEEQIAEYRGQILEAYITQKILLAKAIEETLQVEDRVVQKQLEQKMASLIAQVGSEEKLIDYFQKPLRMIKREMYDGVRDGILIERLKQQHISDVSVRRQEVIEFYEENIDRVPTEPEQAEISHIQLEIEPSEEARTVALRKIKHAQELLNEGADFDSVAIELSEGPSAGDGGRLGFTNRGDLVPQYEEAAYSLEPGAISDIVESPFGLHIIKLLERKGERISTQHILIMLSPTEEDVQQTLEFARELKTELDNGAKFAKLAQEHSDDLETANNGGKLEKIRVQDLPLEFQSAIENLNEGEISDPIRSDYGIHIVKLDEYYPAHKLTLAEDWQTIEMYAIAEKREVKFREWIDELKRDHYIFPPQN